MFQRYLHEELGFVRLPVVWRRVSLIALGILTTSAVPAFGATPVSSCGQTVSGSGFLTGDLDCSATSDPAVIIDGGALDLKGFTITGSDTSGTPVLCTRSCSIVSEPPGGQVTNGAGYGIFGSPSGGKANVKIRNIVVTGNLIGVTTTDGKIDVRDSSISNNSGRGVATAGPGTGPVVAMNMVFDSNGGQAITGNERVKVRESIITGNGSGVLGDKVMVSSSTISGNGGFGLRGFVSVVLKDCVVEGQGDDGIHISTTSGRIKVKSSEVTNNVGHGIFGDAAVPISIKDSIISGNWSNGVHNSANARLKISGSTITDNELHGVFQSAAGVCPTARISSSTISGNATDLATCGVSETCADVSTCVTPILSSVTCDTSYDTGSGFPGNSWSVCVLD